MYSFRNYVFPISLEMVLMHSREMNTCLYQVFELTNQIQCIVRKSISYVTYCADTDADRAFLLLLGRRQANLCFHFVGSGENLPDIAKSRDARVGMKANSFLFQATSCHSSVAHKLPKGFDVI